VSETLDGTDGVFDIVEYCGRLTCRKPIVQSAGRGRRREFCSETCRRGADREYKRAKAMVEHFETNLSRTRYEVAAYGRKAEVDGGFRSPADDAVILETARVALARADGILEFVPGGDDRFLGELRRLAEAVRPLAAGSVAVRATA
jgi:hypothetical protein